MITFKKQIKKIIYKTKTIKLKKTILPLLLMAILIAFSVNIIINIPQIHPFRTKSTTPFISTEEPEQEPSQSCQLIFSAVENIEDTTPTLTLSPTPTQIPTTQPEETNTPSPQEPKCIGLTISKNQITLGESVHLSGKVNGYGLIRTAKVQNTTQRVVQGSNLQTLTQKYFNLETNFTPTQPGIYVFEVNAYDHENCQYLCSAAQILYIKKQNIPLGNCDRSDQDWQEIGQCFSNNCIQWLTVTNPDS